MHDKHQNYKPSLRTMVILTLSMKAPKRRKHAIDADPME